jgi:hypothetical protein
MSATAMLAEAGRPLNLGASGPDTPRAVLDGLRQAVEKLRGLDQKTAAPDVSAAALAALRMIEVRVYADALVARYSQADSSLNGVIRQIRSAHDTHCTCGR